MSIEVARHALLWCAVMNYILLAIWSILFVLSHEWLYRLSARRFRLTAEQFDAVNFAGIVFYKVGIFLLNLVPFLALTFVRGD
ncbi:MAG: DUF6868 family protein [Bryobacteraceae bacterium]